jgi:hypothetical protein
MPIYEFYCPDNHKIYSFYARTLSQGERIPRCPDNPDYRMERLFSKFSVTGRAKEKPETPGDEAMDDPRMMSAMAQMEQEFAGMDTENPDPRQLGRMMRRMSQLTGEKIPPQMEEMLTRMEAGEDPEKLEEEYGDALDDVDQEGGTEGGPGEEKASAKLLRSVRRRPVRDPKLYEISDYL